MFYPKLAAAIYNVLFPARCVSCARRTGSSDRYTVLCDACRERIPRSSFVRCPECLRRATALRPQCHPASGFLLFSASDFSSLPVRALIHALKYSGVHDASEPLGDLLQEQLTEALTELGVGPAQFLLLPAPLRALRERRRGFNQAERLTKALVAKNPGMFALLPEALVKTRDTASQTECADRKTRQKNVAGSFALNGAERLRGANVIIVDDVFTSGATMHEMVRAVRTAQPRLIIGAVVALA